MLALLVCRPPLHCLRALSFSLLPPSFSRAAPLFRRLFLSCFQGQRPIPLFSSCLVFLAERQAADAITGKGEKKEEGTAERTGKEKKGTRCAPVGRRTSIQGVRADRTRPNAPFPTRGKGKTARDHAPPKRTPSAAACARGQAPRGSRQRHREQRRL